MGRVSLSAALPQKKRGGIACLTCSLPATLRAEIAALHKSGRSYNDISIGLGRLGHRISAAALGQHARSGHE